jgi:hypothetical protein
MYIDRFLSLRALILEALERKLMAQTTSFSTVFLINAKRGEAA